jgi:hypothetical protein
MRFDDPLEQYIGKAFTEAGNDNPSVLLKVRLRKGRRAAITAVDVKKNKSYDQQLDIEVGKSYKDIKEVQISDIEKHTAIRYVLRDMIVWRNR